MDNVTILQGRTWGVFFAQRYNGKTLNNSYSNKVVDLLVKTNKKSPPSYAHAVTCRFLQQAGQGKDSC